MPLTKPLGGIITPLLTPLRDPDTHDDGALERLIEHVIAGGVSGVFALGTTGEGPALSMASQAAVAKATVKFARGRVPVLIGIAHASFADSVALARAAADAGADAVVTTGPLYFAVSQDDLLDYVKRIAKASPLPVFLYNMPARAHVTFSVDTVAKAASIKNVIGFKDSSADLGYFHQVLSALAGKRDFSVFIGPEEFTGESVLLGGNGGVNGGSNLFPSHYVALYEAARRRDIDTMIRLHRRVIELSRAVYEPVYLPGIKCAAAALGLCKEIFAAPCAPVDSARRAAIRQFVKAFRAG